MDEGYVIGDWTAAAPALTSSAVCLVNSWNEWDPLEEVIVGRLDGSQAGIRWLRRHLGDRGLRLHELENRCARPVHIDTTFVPLAPGKVLVNPDFIDVDRLPPILKRWDVLIAPRSDRVDGLMAKFSMCSPWTSINVLMLDHRRVVAEASQPTLHRALKDWGFEPLPLPFVAYGPFGGAFHYATLDTRRRGALEDYF
jgi:glycine amidinotransferase